MKKLLVVILTLTALTINAQSFKETFDSNTMGWTESSSKDAEAVIRGGVMHMVGKDASKVSYFFGEQEPSYVLTHCFSTLDVAKNFEIKCDAIAKKMSEDGTFGIILDYFDDGNFIAFTIYVADKNYYAYYQLYRDGKRVGHITRPIKITEKRNANFSFSIKSTYQKLQFYVNDMLALDVRFRPLTSNGFGFYVKGKQTIDFDNVEFIQ